MASVSLDHIKRLAKLHRHNVPGAREQLDDLLQVNGRAVCELLGLGPGSLSTGTIVARLDELGFRARHERQCVARERAEVLARDVGRNARRLPDGSFMLPTASFCALATGAFAYACFADSGRVRTVHLRVIGRLLRVSRSMRIAGVELNETRLRVTYDTPHGRGCVALIARPPRPRDDAVIVDLAVRRKDTMLKRVLAALAEFARRTPEYPG